MRSMTYCDCFPRCFAYCFLLSLSRTDAKIHSVDIAMQLTSTTHCISSEKCSTISFQFHQFDEVAPTVHDLAHVEFIVSPIHLHNLENSALNPICNSGSSGSFCNVANINGVNILSLLDESCRKKFQHEGYVHFVVLGFIAGLIFAAAYVVFLKTGASPLQSIFDKNELIAPPKNKEDDRSRTSIAHEKVYEKLNDRIDFARSTLCTCGKEDRMILERVLALLKTVLLDKALTDKKVAIIELKMGELLSAKLLAILPPRISPDNFSSALWKSEEKPQLLSGRNGKFDYVADDTSRGDCNEKFHSEIIVDDAGADSTTNGQSLISPMSSILYGEIGQSDSEYLIAMTDIKQRLAEELAGVSLLLPSPLPNSDKAVSCRTTRCNSLCTLDSVNQYGLDFEKEGAAFQSILKNTTSNGRDDSSLARRIFF